MDITLISTDGYALEAKINFGGRVFTVMDVFSPCESSAQPGHIFDAEISCMDIVSKSWEEMFSSNPDCIKDLVQIESWDYRGFGQIVEVNPMKIDFGVLVLEGGPSTHDTRCIGEYVGCTVERLQLSGTPEDAFKPKTSVWQRIKKAIKSTS
jgi:hypothetical protein